MYVCTYVQHLVPLACPQGLSGQCIYRTILTHEQTGQCVNTNVSCLFLAHLHHTVHAKKLVLYTHACTHTRARTLTHSQTHACIAIVYSNSHTDVSVQQQYLYIYIGIHTPHIAYTFNTLHIQRIVYVHTHTHIAIAKDIHGRYVAIHSYIKLQCKTLESPLDHSRCERCQSKAS